jgi:hypothetical protein
VSIETFGLSGPGAQVLAEFGFTADNVAEQALSLLEDLDLETLDLEDFENDEEEPG